MSADLFAEFGSEPSTNQSAQSSVHAKANTSPSSSLDLFGGLGASTTPTPENGQPSWSQPQPKTSVLSTETPSFNDENDDWGDFEGTSSLVGASSANDDPFKSTASYTSQPTQPSWEQNSHSRDEFSTKLSSESQPSSLQWHHAPIVKAKASADPTVLFDAEDDLDDDDFGDFEGTETTAPEAPVSKKSSALVDLLESSVFPEPKPVITERRGTKDTISSIKPSNQSKKSIAGSFGDTKKAASAPRSSGAVTAKNEDAWDTFDDWEASIPSKGSKPTTAKTAISGDKASPRGSVAPLPVAESALDESQPGELPPTNVPPPGVLISLFPTLFAEAQEKLFKPMAAQTLSMRNKLMSEPATIAYLRGYLGLANVAAHIIAGRKLRWKRDQHLAQGMRIGPASSRATSGMKLAGIDKGENMKEEREVADAVRLYKEQIGRLRHVVSGINQIKAGTLGPVSDLHEVMPVKTLKQSEGGVPARQPCMLCGLKREERVTAADAATEDSFGEWWIDQVSMHRGPSICPLQLNPLAIAANPRKPSATPRLHHSCAPHSSDERTTATLRAVCHQKRHLPRSPPLLAAPINTDPRQPSHSLFTGVGTPQGMSRPNDGSLPEEPHFDSLTSLRSSNDHVALVKNKSTSNLLSQVRSPPAINTAKRMSIDAGQLDRMARSPIVPEHEHGLGASGLRRIRQLPSTQRATSLNITTPPVSRHPSTSTPTAPASPEFAFGEDLTRFPSESLHSFSFATQSEEFIHNRQNVLKRSIDFMRDRLGWAATNPGIANAQAKLSGDQEVQSMMELLSRANLIGHEGAGAHGLAALGPITGPADISGENLFEKGFLAARSESPESMLEASRPPVHRATTTEIADSASSAQGTSSTPDSGVASETSSTKTREASPPPQRPQRAALKRTLTDVAPLTIQSQLNDVLAQPYTVGEQSQVNHLVSPTSVPTIPPSFSNVPGPHSAGSVPHGHGSRYTPAAQAIFTTESEAPWTITSANDLACLVFGVTRAEVRKLGILEVVREDRRKWLEDKLRNPDSGSKPARESPVQNSGAPMTNLKVGNGVTARLLSKPSSRTAPRKAKTDDGSGSSYYNAKKTGKLNHESRGSRGVLLCGDVIPIQKRNGATGSASLWVKEKRGSLIWVLEEIAEDVVYINVDEVGCVSRGWGAIEAVFGSDRLRRGMDLKRLLPGIPRLKGTNTGALDYDEIAEISSYTARTSNSINIPVTVEAIPGEPTFRVSSFPHIAGIIVLSSSDLAITSSNSVFSSALFGQPRPEGVHISKLIPAFDKILHVMTDEDKIELVDGIVIPEHSFRRARALLAMREGSADAAAIFLRPSGLPALHRDGSEIMVDVQMRVVKSEKTPRFDENVIQEEDAPPKPSSVPDLVYALWITYSRQLHAANHGIGPVTPLLSRPGTPPRQPEPGQSNLIVPEEPSSDHSNSTASTPPVSLLTKQIQESSRPDTPKEPQAKMGPLAAPVVQEPPAKKTINDFVVLEEMGQGAYGQVKLCRYKKNSSKKVVIKYVTKRRILVDTWTRDRRLGTVPLEIHVLDYLRRDGFKHPNIVEMADFFEDDINYYIEMVPHGLPGMDLFDYIELRVNMEEKECKKIFVQVAEAIYHLHIKAKVVHRDIKDENVVLDGEGNIKLIDFGSAAYIKSGPFDVFVGTIDYAAPEVLAGKAYRGKEQDVWALGILLYTIIYKENPFYSIDEIMDHDLRVPWVMSEESIDLVRLMLDRDVEKRITISQVLEHPWCKGATSESESS